MTWYSQLGFKSNPLDSRPNINLIGLREQERQIVNHILKEEICFVNGLTGAGKTSLLKRIQKKLKKHKFIYLDAHDLPKGFNLKKALLEQRSFFDKLVMRKSPKHKPVLIIDEFQNTDPDLVMKIRSKWEDPDKRVIRSVVIAQISKKLGNAADSFKERLGNRIVNLEPLDNDQLIELLKIRLKHSKKRENYLRRFSDDAVNTLINASGGNPRRLLEYTDMVFDYHYNKFKKLNPMRNKSYKVNEHLVRQILDENKILIKDKEKSEFEKAFTLLERHIIEFLADREHSREEIGKELNMAKKTLEKLLIKLEKNDYIISRNIGGEKRFSITQRTHRLMVKE